jgi:hypothetical protein
MPKSEVSLPPSKSTCTGLPATDDEAGQIQGFFAHCGRVGFARSQRHGLGNQILDDLKSFRRAHTHQRPALMDYSGEAVVPTPVGQDTPVPPSPQ